jgi:hypothetical protein
VIAGWIAGGGLGAAAAVIVGAWAVAVAGSKRSARRGAAWRDEIRLRAAQPGYTG